MKSFCKASFLLLMAVAILASSTGITLFKMVCDKSGKEFISLQQLSDCCTDKTHSQTEISKKCCDISSQTFKLYLLQKSEWKTPLFILQATDLVSVSSWLTSFPFYSYSKLISASPPLFGRQLLHSISTLLI